MTNIRETGIGTVLRSYYPLAFVTQQDVLFRVNGPGQALPGITKDEKESTKIMKQLWAKPELEEALWNKILSELDVHGFNTSGLKNDMEFNSEETDGDKINVIVPSKIDLRLDKGTNVAACEGCGHLNYINLTSQRNALPTHIGCEDKYNNTYRQSPVYVPFPNDKEVEAVYGSSDQLKIQSIPGLYVNCLHFKKGFCNHTKTTDSRCVDYPAGQHSYLWAASPNFPIRGIKVVNNKCPKGLTDIKPRSLPMMRANEYHYRKTWPNNRITKRLSTKVAWEDPTSSESIDGINDKINEVKNNWFRNEIVDLQSTKFSRIKFIDVVYGIQLGGFLDHWITGEKGENHVLGRMLDTQGFMITIRNNILETAAGLTGFGVEEAQDKVNIIIHTLEHAIRSMLPSSTGLEETKFEASYEILEEGKGARIFLFDNEAGGHGGFATLMSHVDRFSDMIESIYKRVKCPIRNCKFGCEHCVYLRNCGQSNLKLNRKMLLDSGILQQQM